MKKILSLLLAVVMVFGLMTAAFAADADLAGKTVVLHTNDVHGQVDLYAKVAALKKDYEAKGADVILVDAGDYAQGTPYVSDSQGKTAIELMNAAGYDVVTLGNHEFDYGYANLQTIMKDAKFKVVCNIKYNGKLAFDASYVVETKGGLKVGFLGLTTPETSTKAHPAKIKGVTFMAQNALYSFATQEAANLKAGGSDVVIALTHLGVDPESKPNRSTDLYANAKGIDFIIDGHSHTKMTEGENGEPIQSTETKLKYVGVVVIDNATKKIESNELIQLDGYANEDADTKAAADAIITDVDARLGAVFAKSEVELNGKRDPGVRTQETNLGDLITDALLWYATKDGKLDVPADHIVAVTNGGGIRASIKAGDITMKDINTVLPFGNTVAVVYISGEKLLESLEAATQSAPTALGGFPQIAGINLSLCTGAAYDKQDETYPGGSTYYGPKSINRVTINSINGKPFRAKDTYAVVTNDFMAAGGDVYYAFASSPKIVDTGTPMDEALVEFIKVKLNGVIGKEYENAQGRLNMAVFNDVPNNIWYTKAVNYVAEKSLMNGTGASFKPMDSTSRAMLVTVLYRMAGSPEVEGKVSETFKDCVDGSYYANAVLWASQNNIVNGYGDSFKPNQAVTRQEMAKILYGYDKVMEKAGETFAVQLTYTDLDSIAGWALEGVNYCTAAGYLSGSNNAFSPKGNATRAMTAQVLMNMTAEKEAA